MKDTKNITNFNSKRKKQERGITLIALVITIIILIILATVTITLVFGEGGLIQRAQEGKELTEQAQKSEQEELKGAEEYINGILEGTDLPNTPDDSYIDDSIVVAPQISSGMTPVKYDEEQNKWVKTEITDSDWYDYGNKEWANVVLVEENGKDADGDQDVFNADGTLNEASNYSMLVWIPRYAYKINSQYHQSGTGAGEIDIVFIGTDNKGKDGNKTYSTTYPSVSGDVMSDYVVHPAFDYGGTALAGFWIGKFETSHTGCTTDSSTGSSNTNTTDLTLQIKAGVTSWRNINVSNIFTVCTEMNREGNPYGLNTNDSVVDPHIIKNSEWGAVAYLSQNTTYGKGSEVWNNPSSNYITGQTGSSSNESNSAETDNYNEGNGPQASTTGNVTGVYDMRGGSWEYTAAYVENEYTKEGENAYIHGQSLIDSVNAGNKKYADIYNTGTNDTYKDNYIASNPGESTGHYGDAVWETSDGSGDGSSESSYRNSWYGDYSLFPIEEYPFFLRGGVYTNSDGSGVFCFSRDTRYDDYGDSFRVVIAIP